MKPIYDEEPVQPNPINFGTEQMVDHANWTKAFRVHAGIAGVVSFLCLLIWVITSFATAVHPFWIYVVLFFGITLGFHFYILVQEKNHLAYHVTCYVLINLALFTENLYDRTVHKWFLYPLFAMLIPLAIHYNAVTHKGRKDRGWRIHLAIYLTVNLLLFQIWIESSTVFPYWLITLIAGAIPLAIHYDIKNYFGYERGFAIHKHIYTSIQLLCFFIWLSSGGGFPWFFIVLIVWTPFFIYHIFRYRKIMNTLPQKSAQPRQSNPAPSPNPAPYPVHYEQEQNVQSIVPSVPASFYYPPPTTTTAYIPVTDPYATNQVVVPPTNEAPSNQGPFVNFQ